MPREKYGQKDTIEKVWDHAKPIRGTSRAYLLTCTIIVLQLFNSFFIIFKKH